jgi:hypothetical protein
MPKIGHCCASSRLKWLVDPTKREKFLERANRRHKGAANESTIA